MSEGMMRLVILPEDSTVPHQWTVRKDWKTKLNWNIRSKKPSIATDIYAAYHSAYCTGSSLISHSGLSNLTLKKR